MLSICFPLLLALDYVFALFTVVCIFYIYAYMYMIDKFFEKKMIHLIISD